jgi:hypothetical protein
MSNLIWTVATVLLIFWLLAVTLRETGAAVQDRIEPLDRSSGVDHFLPSS